MRVMVARLNGFIDKSRRATNVLLYSFNLAHQNRLCARVTTELNSGGMLNSLFSLIFSRQVFLRPPLLSLFRLLKDVSSTTSTRTNVMLPDVYQEPRARLFWASG
jgi:hypothetical protein